MFFPTSSTYELSTFFDVDPVEPQEDYKASFPITHEQKVVLDAYLSNTDFTDDKTGVPMRPEEIDVAIRAVQYCAGLGFGQNI